jgi:uncharacterized delta-60 repeat protein
VRVFPQSDGNLAATGAAYLGHDRAPSVFRFAPDGTILDDNGPRDTTPPNTWTRLHLPDGRTVRAESRSTLYGWEAGDHRFAFITTNSAGTTLAEFEVRAITIPGIGTPPPNRSVKLVALADGRVAAGGNLAGGLIRIQVDGTRDATFSAPAEAAAGWFRDLLALPDGSVVLARGGTLESLDVVGPAALIRIAADGTLDPSLVATLDDPLLHAALPDGRILVGSATLRRLNPNGSADGSFDASSAALAHILSVRRLTDGRLLAAGGYANKLPTVCLLSADGARLSDFLGLFPGSRAVALDGLDTSGHAWVRHGYSGAVYRDWVEGITASVISPVNARVRLPAGGAPELVAFAFSKAPWVDGAVQTLKPDGDGRIVVGGNFDLIDDVEHHQIARLRRDGTVDHAYAPPANLGPAAWPAQVHPDGRVLVQGTGGGSAPYMRRLLPDGTVDATLPADCALVTTLQLTVFAIDRDGGYLVRRTQPHGKTPAFAEVQRYAENGSLSWTTRNPGGLPVIQGIAPTADGRVIVLAAAYADRWPQSAGWRLLALRADGTLDDTYRPALPAGASITQIVLMPDGSALVALDVLTEALQHRSRTVRVRTDGSLDPDFRLGPGDEGIVSSSAIHPTSDGGFLARFPVSVALAGYVPPFNRWLRDGARVPEFSATLPAEPYTRLLLTTDDVLYTAGAYTLDGSISAALVRHLPSRTPGILREPQNTSAVAGAEVILTAAVGDSGPVGYQWQRDGIDLAGENDSRLILAHASTADTGTYRCVIRIGSTTHVTNGAVVQIAPNTAKLVNFSARSRVEPGHTQIGGIVVDDPAGQPALLRAIGSALPWDLGVPLLPDPLLTLHERATIIAEDRGGVWSADILALCDRVGAFRPRSPAPDQAPAVHTNSALARTLAPGIYTAHTTAHDGQPGVSLFEYYDTEPATANRGVRNLSIRAITGPGADVLIPGFVVRGTGNIRLLIRAIGPSLARFGVGEPVADPRIIVRAFGTSGPDATNDDWGGDPAIVAAAGAVSAFALDPASKDAALLVTLPAGAYTVQIPAAGDQRGEVLAEIYVLDP